MKTNDFASYNFIGVKSLRRYYNSFDFTFRELQLNYICKPSLLLIRFKIFLHKFFKV